jgi:hypothetical protein
MANAAYRCQQGDAAKAAELLLNGPASTTACPRLAWVDPERKLYAAVLTDALLCVRPCHPTRVQRDALHWFAGVSARLSLAMVCEALQFDQAADGAGAAHSDVGNL